MWGLRECIDIRAVDGVHVAGGTDLDVSSGLRECIDIRAVDSHLRGTNPAAQPVSGNRSARLPNADRSAGDSA